MKLTDSQRKAIKTLDKNIAVNAGAGSGKTRVLVERYVNILENGKLEAGKEVDSIVAITFTKKAAAEMKERVRSSINERIKENHRWKGVYRDIEKAHISTIHSFCSRLLRENPVEGKIDPSFSLLDDYDGKKLLSQITEDYILEGIEKNNRIFKLIEYFTPESLEASSFSDNLIDTIRSIYEKVRSTGISFLELKNRSLSYLDNLKVDINIVMELRDKLSYIIAKSTKNSKLGKLANNPIWIDFSSQELKELDEKTLHTIEYLSDNIGTCKGEETTIEEIKSLISEVLKVEERNRKEIYEVILDLLIEIDRRYSEEKEKMGSLDYEDLQIKAMNLLDNEDIKKRCQERYKYIMVDEFQDTNELQKNIIYKLCSQNSTLDRNNLFVVGDPKQSIYGFRGADIDVFYGVLTDIENISGEETISLKDNFRTVDSVMGFINNIFTKLIGTKYEALIPNKESNKTIDVIILEAEELQIPEDIQGSEYIKKFESQLIAKKMKELVTKENYEYRDIAMLFRSTTDIMIYEEALKEYGIPYYNVGGRGFYKRQEIIDIINGLKAINNKYDNLALISTLRSPMLGLSDSTLYWIVKKYGKNIFQGLNEELTEVTEEENKKIKRSYEILNKLNNIKYSIKTYDLVEELLKETGYIETWMLRFGGKQAMANIFKFIESVKEFNDSGNYNLDDFLDYIDSQLLEDVDEGQAQIESESGNTVKLMTIHKSKGLQFKIVVIPQMAKQFNMTYPNILFDKNMGIGIKHPNLLGKLNKDISPIYNEILKNQQLRDMEENKRVLYVAMTRAEEKLIIGNQSTERLRESFKKFLDGSLSNLDLNYTKINHIDIEKGNFKRIASMPREIQIIDKLHNNSVPLLKTFQGVGGRDFSTFSVTQYMTFNDCMRRFYMTYYRRLSTDIIKDNDFDFERIEINSATKGLIVHKICELNHKGLSLPDLIDKSIREQNIVPTDKITEEISLYVNNYLDYYKDDYDKVLKEREFYYSVGNKHIYGIIDRINIKDGRAEIVDFKTNNAVNTEYIKRKYESQIQLYTSAVKDIYRIDVERAGLLLLQTGDFINIDIDDNKLMKNIDNIKEFTNFVISNNDMEAYKKREGNCDYCQFKELCNDI